MGFLDTQEVIDLRSKIIDGLKQDEHLGSSKMSLSFALARICDDKDLQLLETIEQQVGEDEANIWLTKALVDSGLYNSDDNVFVERLA